MIGDASLPRNVLKLTFCIMSNISKWLPIIYLLSVQASDDNVDMKLFVNGLKSRIKSEISLLLALEDDEAAIDPAANTSGVKNGLSDRARETLNAGQLREYFTGRQSKMRKFLPMPLLRGGRSRRTRD